MGSALTRRLAAAEDSGIVDLRGLSLTSVPAKVWSLDSVVRLHLGWNNLKTLPHTLGSLRTLAVLYVNHNSLKVFPRGILGCARLRRLYLNSNALTEIPDAICDLVHLRVLALSDNAISTLPREMTRLKLQELYLANNKLTMLPEALGAMTDLRILSVASNGLTSLPFSALLRMHDLKELYLDGNPKLGDLASSPLHDLLALLRVWSLDSERHPLDSSSSMWRTRSFSEAELERLALDSASDSGDDDMDPVIVRRRRAALEVVGNNGATDKLKKRTLADIMEAANQLPGVEASLHPLLPIPSPPSLEQQQQQQQQQQQEQQLPDRSFHGRTVDASMGAGSSRGVSLLAQVTSGGMPADSFTGSVGGPGVLSHTNSFYQRKGSKLMNTEDVIRTMRVLLDEAMLKNAELEEELGRVESLRGEERIQFNDTVHTLESRIAVGRDRVANLVATINDLRGVSARSRAPKEGFSRSSARSVAGADGGGGDKTNPPDSPVSLLRRPRSSDPGSALYSRSTIQWMPPSSPTKRKTSTRVPPAVKR